MNFVDFHAVLLGPCAVACGWGKEYFIAISQIFKESFKKLLQLNEIVKSVMLVTQGTALTF